MTKLLGQKLKSYNLTRVLGEGAFAVVYEAFDEVKKEVVAVKAIKQQALSSSRKLKELVKTEIAVLKSCNNPNVISFIDTFETDQFLFIVTEFCNGGDLEQYLNSKGKLSENEATEILKQILNGFKGLHEVRAMHRDFKLANVLLHNKVCKIADLGFAKQMEEREIAKTILGTSVTMAPEVLEEKPYGFVADIWSIGVVFYQLIYGKYPFYGKNDYDLLKKIKNQKVSFQGVNISKSAKQFISRCLVIDPTKRISWKEIYQHNLIAEKNPMEFLPGKLQSKVNIVTNKKFYDMLKLPQKSNRDQKIRQSQSLQIQKLSDKMIRASLQIQELKGLVFQQKQSTQIFDSIENRYINKRNDIMFVNKYIQPNIKSFLHLRMNHPIAMFIVCKKTFMRLITFKEDMKQNKNVFKIQKGFDLYSKSENYQNMINQLRDDIKNIQKECWSYKQNIKICPLEIKEELLACHKTKNNNYNSLMKNLLDQYAKLLVQSLEFVKEEARQDFLKLIEAIDYFKENPKVNADEFEKSISTVNIEKLEQKLKKKYKN